MTEKLLTIDKGLFYVIEFYDGIQIIPYNWVIENENLAYWLKVKSDKDFDIIVYTRSSVKDDWTLESIKTILYKTDLFSNAKLKLKKAEYQSDVDSPYNTDERKKQRRNNVKVQFSDSSDNEEQIREKKKKVKPKKKRICRHFLKPVAMYSKANISNSSSCSVAATFSKTNILNNSSYSIASATIHNKAYSDSSCSIVDINSSKSQKLDVVLSSNNDKGSNYEINQILKAVESLKVFMNGLIALIREVIHLTRYLGKK